MLAKCAFGFVVALSSLATATPALGQDSATLYCRGPLEFRISGIQTAAVEIIIIPSRTAAGPRGRNLARGRCAWPDRPLNASEPKRLLTSSHRYVDYLPPEALKTRDLLGWMVNIDFYNRQAMTLTNYVGRDDYVIEFGAANRGTWMLAGAVRYIPVIDTASPVLPLPDRPDGIDR